MSALEDDLGVQLFHRSHNGVVASEPCLSTLGALVSRTPVR